MEAEQKLRSGEEKVQEKETSMGKKRVVNEKGVNAGDREKGAALVDLP